MLSSCLKEVNLAQFLVRDVAEAVAVELKRRAAEHGRSTESEHREVLREALLKGRKPAKRSFTQLLASMPYFPEDDDLFDLRRRTGFRVYLLDTSVVSELRKRPNASWGVRRFFEAVDPDALFLPAQVIGEIRAGIAKLRRRGATDHLKRATVYDARLTKDLLYTYGERIIEFDADCAMVWSELLSGGKTDPHAIGKQIAAMALIRDMTVDTRDQGASFCSIPNLKLLNPFAEWPLGLARPWASAQGSCRTR